MASTSSLDLERLWWGDCRSTFHEEQKQLVYARGMGLRADWDCGHPPAFEMGGAGVVDIGGGPVSLLLKCTNLGSSVVVDPCAYPEWVLSRYDFSGIDYLQIPGEDLSVKDAYDEAWIYNCLQHVEDPQLVVHNALRAAKYLRIFEWINIEPYEGHPQVLRETDLNRWVGGHGTIAYVNDSGAEGLAYYGVFGR